MSKNKEITIDDLAMMVKRGFDDTASKDDIKELKDEFSDLKDEFSDLKDEFSGLKKENQIEHEKIRRAIGNLEFIATEMVRRDEFLVLKQQVELLKQKIA